MSTAGKPAAEPIFLPEAEDAATRAPYAARIAEMEARGIEVPQILYLLALASPYIYMIVMAAMR